MEESGQARGSGSAELYQDMSNSRRTLHASESCIYVTHVARYDRSGYRWLLPLLGERWTDQVSAETPGNDWTGLAGGVGPFVLKVMAPSSYI